MAFFDKIKAGLSKTRDALSNTLGSVFSGFSEIDDDFYDELEESLILADLGVETSTKATESTEKDTAFFGFDETNSNSDSKSHYSPSQASNKCGSKCCRIFSQHLSIHPLSQISTNKAPFVIL